MRRGHHAWCAEATLQRMMLTEGCLQRSQIVIPAQTFDGHNIFAGNLHRQGQTRPYRLAIDDYRAGAADAVLATEMGPGKAQHVAQTVGQTKARFHIDLERFAIDLEGDLHDAASCKARSIRIATSARR